MTHNEIVFSLRNKAYCLSDIQSVWYRRGDFGIDTLPNKNNHNKSMCKNYNEREEGEIKYYVHRLFEKKRNINNHNLYHVNKLDVLCYCHNQGINDAQFMVTQSKKELWGFYKTNSGIISKSVYTPYVMLTGMENYYSYTTRIYAKDIDRLPDYFTPTFFQGNIDKKYEIRSFYLHGSFYSMAIFSQNNKQTEVDFRKYDWDNPNRVMPYKLPKWFERKPDEAVS